MAVFDGPVSFWKSVFCERPETYERPDLGKVARPERFELPTLWFEARCSDPLSYGRVRDIIAPARGNSITAAGR